jgi:hypothetical protein
VQSLLRRYPQLVTAAIFLAAAYSVIHVVVSGVMQPLRVPATGQVIEELQPLYRMFTTGAATVDHPRQYGPVFLALFHPVYRFTMTRPPELLAWYAYALDVIAIFIAFIATRRAIRRWAEMKGVTLPRLMTPALLFLWANFSPLYGVLAVKNVELWELALMAVAGAALLEHRRWLAAWSIAAAALTKMLPLVFFPYLLLRDRRAFVYALAAFAGIIAIAQLLYGSEMGFGYVPMIVRAALGGESFGWREGVWHENVSIRGVAFKAFGFLEEPGRMDAYQVGYFAIVPPDIRPFASAAGLVAEAVAAVWVVSRLIRHHAMSWFDRLYWEWALVAVAMLILAPQISQDYMVLALGAFSYVLAGCMIRGDKWLWLQFAAAVLLVANVVPRGLFARLMGIGPISRVAGTEHLLPAEAYQYFGFPLLGLLILLRVWSRLAGANAREDALRPATGG